MRISDKLILLDHFSSIHFTIPNYKIWQKSIQRVQGLQAFAFCVLIVNDEHTKRI